MFSKDKNKAFLLLLLGLIAASFNFWLTSRYPDLGAKSALGGNAPLAGLGFGPLYEIKQNFTFAEKLFYGTLNWLDTNRRGMTFSFIVGAFLLSLFPLIEVKRPKNGLFNALLGGIAGTPLGLCVNCTAPIAQAMYICGVRLETSLAFLISSPTMNIVILMMLFSLFPLYLALYKVLFTLIFVLIVIPLGCRFFFQKEVSQNNNFCSESYDSLLFQSFSTEISGGWYGAIKWVIYAYIKNFIRILILTGPLMIVAGFLGTLIISIVSWENIQTLNDAQPFAVILLIMAGIALIGTLLPAPMAFDVAMSAALLQAGVPIVYVAVFLFTLGSYSLYAFMVIWRAVSLRVALFLMISAVFLGFLMGLSAMQFDGYYKTKAQFNLQSFDQAVQDDPHLDPIIKRTDKAIAFSDLKSELESNKAEYTNIGSEGDLVIDVMPFAKSEKADLSEQNFNLLRGEDLGLVQPYRVSYTAGLDMIPRLTTSIAAGDVHNDGWEDLLIMGDPEISPNLILFANIGGKKFIRQSLPIADDVVLVALADLNSDYWLDIIYATYSGENFVIYNDKGEFLESNKKLLANVNPGTTNNIGFGDVDKDGVLEILVGNWSVGPLFLNEPASKNMILNLSGDSYIPTILPGLSGETLTSLIWDFNNDTNLDIFFGNDFIDGRRSDLILLGDGKGGFSFTDETFPRFLGAQSTMSIDFADLDHDLKPEFFIGQIAYIGNYMRAISKIAEKQISFDDYCKKDSLSPKKTKQCIEEMEFKKALAKITNFVSDACEGINNPNYKKQCEIHLANYQDYCSSVVSQKGNIQFPKKIIASPRYAEFCLKFQKANDNNHNHQYPEELLNHHLEISNPSLSNILLEYNEAEHKFEDHAKELGVSYGGWTWNAKFADLDNDSWQDIYLVNGYSRSTVAETKVFYRNKGNRTFEDATKSFGLEDYSPASAYVYVDFDHDGDLDIVSVPVDGSIKIFKNTTDPSNSIEFTLIDHSSPNTYAIGAKVTIHYRLNGKHVQQIGYIKASGGYKSFDPTIIHFGLGSAYKIEEINIEWPDGKKNNIKSDIKVNQRYKIVKQNIKH